MHTVELLEEALSLAEQLGYQTRQEWLGGAAGGACEIKGCRWIFLDLAAGPADQLEQVVEALRYEPRAVCLPMSQPLRDLLGLRKTA